MRLKIEDDRILQLQEMSNFLGVEIEPTVEDIRNFPDFSSTVRTLGDVQQSTLSRREKAFVEILEDTSLNEILDSKFEKAISTKDKLLIEFLDERLELITNVTRIETIVNNIKDQINPESLDELNKCIQKVLKSKIRLFG